MSGTARPLGLGIAGAGGFAEFITAAVADLPSVRLAAVTDADHERAARLAAATGITACLWLELLTNPDVDAIVVATPPDTHAELAIAALRATALAGTESLRTGTTVEITQINAS